MPWKHHQLNSKVHCGGAIGTHIAQPKIRRWQIFGCWPQTSCIGECLWLAIGLMQTNDAACNMACPQVETCNLVFS